MIWYFQKDLKPSIQAQLDAWGRELDTWEEAIKKTVNAKVKTLLQSASSTCKMDSRCPQRNRSVKKEEKDSGRTKSTNISSTDASSGKH